VGALSYAGQFNITAVADRELCPDLEVFVKGVRSSLDALADDAIARYGIRAAGWRDARLVDGP
jgi:hypothetical protein